MELVFTAKEVTAILIGCVAGVVAGVPVAILIRLLTARSSKGRRW